MSEWQPIDTAPKDGTLTMFYVPGLGRYPVCRGDDYWFGADYLVGATYWRPLPAPPEPEE